jgi:hypothetical protein
MPQLSGPARGEGVTRPGSRFLAILALVTLLVSITLIPIGHAAAVTLTLGASSGAPGATITFTGVTDNATAGWTLYWGTTAGTALASGVASGGIASGTFTVPEIAAGVYTVVLMDNITTITASAAFTVNPSLTVSPVSGTPGTSVTVTGHGFAAAETGLNLTFDGAAVVSGQTAGANGLWTATFNLPEAAGGAAHVIDASGATTNAASVTDLAFTITPFITLTPPTGSVGTSLNISGKGFAASESGISVTLDAVTIASATAAANGSWAITCTLPDSTRGAHVVDAFGATTTAALVPDLSFTVTSGLSIIPVAGIAGTPVTVTGTGFAASENGIVVALGARTVKDAIAADARGRWTTIFTIPPGSGGSQAVNAYGPVTVSGTVTPITFSITAKIALAANSGKVGSPVTVTGSSFTGGETGVILSWDGGPVSSGLATDANGNLTATFNLPAATAGIHKIRVTSPLSPAGAEADFVVSPDLVVSPSTGNVGSAVNLTGTGFGPGRPLTVTWDGAAVTPASPATSTAQGGFTLGIAAPRSKGGSHAVKVTDGANFVEAAWAMESTPPPVPPLVRPTAGEIKSLFGDVDVTYEWSSVNDPSGVAYRLQVARDEQFTDIMTDKPDLTATSLTVAKMPLGTYYWRVKAVDLAANESTWSPVYEVKSGFMPVWAFAASIAGALLVIILAVVGVMRRNRY